MGKRADHRRSRRGASEPPSAVASSTRQGPTSVKRARISIFERVLERYRARRTVFRFIGLLILFLGCFYFLLATNLAREWIVPGYLHLWADVSAAALRTLGEQASSSGFTVSSPRFRFDILHGCDAIDPTVLFIAAVLASPVGWRRKVLGLLFGVTFLLVMNLIRVLSLYYIGVHAPSMFELMHYEIWQAVFIVFSILCWGLWAIWAVKGQASQSNALT
jgi:exosortase/archaeosortase family protein